MTVTTATTASSEGSPLARAWGRWPGTVLRVLIAVLPIAWLSQRVQWHLVLSRATHVGVSGLALSILATFGTLALGALRWGLMLRAYGADPAKRPRFLTLLRHYFVGQYFAVLPTGVAGEAVRGYRVASCFPDPATSYVVLFVERVAGLLGLLSVAGIAAALSPEARGGAVAAAMNVGLTLALGAGALVFAVPQITARWPAGKAMVEAIPLVGKIMRRVPPAKRIAPLFGGLILSAMGQMGMVLSVVALLAPLAPTATISACARVVPPIILVTYIPLTPGGLGQREAAFVHFFSLVHVEHEAAVAASLLFFAVFLFTSLTGGAILLYERARGLT